MAEKDDEPPGALMSDDEVSLNSSDSEQQDDYTVQEILAERLLDDETPRYLVRWENYGEERCTWEPVESFLDPRSLQDWYRRRDAGIQLADDIIDGIEAKMIAYEDAKELRRARRLKKRRQLAATRSAKLSAKATPTNAAETAPHPRRDTVQAIMPLVKGGRVFPASAEVQDVLVTGKKVSQSESSDGLPGIASQIITAKRPVFHGISMPTAKRNGHNAHRTGGQRNSKMGSFRNLRHLNNVRKAARRERSPDAKSIQLRSLADWSKSAPEDTNVQLPPLPASSISISGARTQASTKGIHSAPNITSGAQPAPMSSRDPPSGVKPSNASEDKGLWNSAAKQDSIAHNRFNPYEGRERKLRTVASGRSFYYPGEVLITLKFGNACVGDVRLSGIPYWAIGQIINLKGTDVVLNLEIGTKDVVMPNQWAQLCTGRSNALQPTGVIIPYEDTAKAVTEMESYLHRCTLAALWYHPSADFMLVFYSPRSKAWMFLERCGGLPFDGNIRVLTRNKMPPTEVLAKNDPVESSTSTHGNELQKPVLSRASSFSALPSANNRVSDPGSKSDNDDVPQPSRPRRLSVPAVSRSAESTFVVNTQSLNAGTAAYLQAQQTRSSKHVGKKETVSKLHQAGNSDLNEVQPDVFGPEPEGFQLKLRPGQSIGEAFESLFKISYAHLTAVPSSKNADCDPAKARFYIVYPDSASAELDSLQEFLRSYTFHTNICTSRDERGWDAFQNIYRGDYIGVILFHKDCNRYHTLPRLSSLLRYASLNVFRISLAHPLHDCDDACHLERLFPSGMAVLVTEACLASDGVAILKWFGRKGKGSSWKLVLPPNIKNRLRQKALKLGQGDGERFIDTLQELDTLNPGFSALRHHSNSDGDSFSEAESIDGLSDGSGEPGSVLAPSVIPAYDRQEDVDEKGKDHVLIEYFAGWAITNSGFHRKFVAITPFAGTTYNKWGHIEVLKPEKFMQRENIEVKQQAGALKS